MSDVYSLRCFHNNIRRLTHTLSIREAKTFHHTAKHMQAYLEKEYGVPSVAMPEVDETWTKADVRRLARLLAKRKLLLAELCSLVDEEWAIEYKTTTAIDDLLREAR